jgi:hypothetical protein
MSRKKEQNVITKSEPSRKPSETRTTALLAWEPNDNGGERAVATAEGTALVERMSANAHSVDTIAQALGVGRRTFLEMRDRQPELREAYVSGRGFLATELASLLLKKARGGNLAAAIFLTKAMCGFRETGPSDDNAAPRVAIAISLPPAMTEAAYVRVIEGEQPHD